MRQLRHAAEDTTINRRPYKRGFEQMAGGKGSHRKFRHPRLSGAVILSGKEGDDAHHYQEKQVRNAIRELKK